MVFIEGRDKLEKPTLSIGSKSSMRCKLSEI
ncbi:hypothetical protein CBU_0058 [Coxiella burnetii RSA 493]|uniref:Uncharacterized protein n=1 Tax=Coxiella burnetii (strain RSA 493 / Nine Mile phase I) TaxID=227377 RepID=Q83F90_COXBU|nr:hypothetical protein CBU_0058 [Coxiella burnetii RSA 493]BBL37715.1 hypothetical protein CBU406_C18680 [Coxiella burnetii]BBL37928.1 hypothetical protein CBUVS42_C00610 [Coxiella burnetii]